MTRSFVFFPLPDDSDTTPVSSGVRALRVITLLRPARLEFFRSLLSARSVRPCFALPDNQPPTSNPHPPPPPHPPPTNTHPTQPPKTFPFIARLAFPNYTAPSPPPTYTHAGPFLTSPHLFPSRAALTPRPPEPLRLYVISPRPTNTSRRVPPPP